jgi:hypothetical protein
VVLVELARCRQQEQPWSRYRSPRPEELEALIREARARQRKRWIGAATAVALLAGGALAAYSVATGGSAAASQPAGGPSAAKPGEACGVRGLGVRILDGSGRTVYREPGHYARPDAGFPTIRCSGSNVWAVWFDGAGMSQEAYVGARSLDAGRTWKLVFSEAMFGPKAPHHFDSYLGPWTLHGRAAYFIGSCPACSTATGQGTVSLWVTKDAGRTFRTYRVPALTGYWPTHIRVSGDDVTIETRRLARKLDHPPFEIYGHRVVSVRVA